ncbi:hypothetical protein ACUNHJ_10250 [Serratia sp. IR-2025]
MDKFSELSRPVRIHRDWNRASMCHCGKCDRWEMTIADADGVQTCASCYDAEWLSEWQNYAEAAEKRIAELEAKLATPVRLHRGALMVSAYAANSFNSEWHLCLARDSVVGAIRAAGFTVEGDE